MVVHVDAGSTTNGASESRAGVEGTTNMNCVDSLGVSTEEGKLTPQADGSGLSRFGRFFCVWSRCNI